MEKNGDDLANKVASAEQKKKQTSSRPLSVIPLEKWVDTTRRLLSREKDEEIALMQQELDTLDDLQNPNVLVNLRLVQNATGLFGRTVLKFAFPSAHVQRPKPHQFTVGDLVQIRVKKSGASTASSAGAKYPTGIVARVEETGISIALGENEEVEEEDLLAKSVTLDRLVNNATFAKISSALDQLAKYDYGAAQSVVEM